MSSVKVFKTRKPTRTWKSLIANQSSIWWTLYCRGLCPSVSLMDHSMHPMDYNWWTTMRAVIGSSGGTDWRHWGISFPIWGSTALAIWTTDGTNMYSLLGQMLNQMFYISFQDAKYLEHFTIQLSGKRFIKYWIWWLKLLDILGI